MSSGKPINPQTRVAELLEEHPDLEEMLIEQSPMFSKLKNPVLRKTVARVATLEQAARMADIPVSDLVNRLREAAGQPVYREDEDGSGKHAQSESSAPGWVRDGTVKKSLDADSLMEGGGNPLREVTGMLGSLGPGELIRITGSFPPIPLRESLGRAGHRVVILGGGGRYETFVAGRESGRED